MELYQLDGKQMNSMLKRLHVADLIPRNDCDEDYVEIFCEETGIKPDEIDLRDIEILGKIVLTTLCGKGLVTKDIR